MKSRNLGRKYEYEFLDKRFCGYKQKIIIDAVKTKSAQTAKKYWNHLESKLDNSNNREYVDKLLTNFSNAMRRFSPFYSYDNVNTAFENTTRELIDKKVEYLEFNKKDKKNKKLSNLIENSMVSCTEQNCFLLSCDNNNNWKLYNSLDKKGNKKSHTIIAREFNDFYGVIDITLGWKREKKEAKNNSKYGNVYTMDKKSFKENYSLSKLKSRIINPFNFKDRRDYIQKKSRIMNDLKTKFIKIKYHSQH